MKIFRLFAVLVLAALTANVAWADSVPNDPSIIVRGGGGSLPIDSTFTFTSDQFGGGVFDFFNSLNVDILSLAITTQAPSQDLSLFNCGTGGLFANCGFTLNPDGTITVLFSGAGDDDDFGEFFDEGGFPGIEEGQHFLIDLGEQGWVPNALFTAVTNQIPTPIPEPGTLVLLLGGIGVVALWKKSR